MIPRQRVALHESGHAVVGYLVGLELGLVSILGRETFAGFTEHVTPDWLTGLEARCADISCGLAGQIAEELADPAGYWDVDADVAKVAADALAALPPGERAFHAYLDGPQPHWPGDDFDRARKAAGMVDEADHFLGWLSVRTRRIVYQHADAIRAFADALLIQPVMDGPTARSAVIAALERSK